jgi:hypothetical protein
METLIAVIVAFTLAGFAWPAMIRHRGMFFLSILPTMFLLLLYVLLTVAAQARAGYEFVALFAFAAGLLQIAAVLLLFLAFSGLSLWEMLQEIAASFRSLRGRPPGFPVIPPPPPGESGDRK